MGFPIVNTLESHFQTRYNHPMRTFNADTGDLSFAVIDELDSVMQRVAQRLRFRLGEWFLRDDRGTDYDPILGSYGVDDLAIAAFTAEAASVDEVNAVTDVRYSLNNETRIFRYTANVQTPYGTGTLDLEL